MEIIIIFFVLFILYFLIKAPAAKKKLGKGETKPINKKNTNIEARTQTKPSNIPLKKYQPVKKPSPKIGAVITHKNAASKTTRDKYNFYLYHFTDPRNIPSIKKNGLLSWEQLLKRNIIHYPASNELSRNLDRRYKLEDYVRLSLNQKHPMFSAAIYYGRVQSLVWLKIMPNVIDLPGALFSNTNATCNQVVINQIKDTALKSNDVQAEILVKERIDPTYIIFNAINDSPFYNNSNQPITYDDDDLPF